MITTDCRSCVLRLQQVNLSHNQLTSLPSGLLHLTRVQRVFAAKNRLCTLFDIPQGTFTLQLLFTKVPQCDETELTIIKDDK